MKSILALCGIALLVVVGAATPDGDAFLMKSAEAERGPAIGVVLETDIQSAKQCRLVVLSNSETVLDHGACDTLRAVHEITGSFRFWQEPAGRVLYVYDDTQSLRCRICNPESVTLVEVVD